MLDSTANLYSLCHQTLTNQSAAIAHVTGHTYALLANQSATIAYVTGHTYAVLTNQRAAMAYVTVCTSRGVRTLFDQSGHDILMRVRPLNMCAQPRAPLAPPLRPPRPPCAPRKKRVDRPL